VQNINVDCLENKFRIISYEWLGLKILIRVAGKGLVGLDWPLLSLADASDYLISIVLMYNHCFKDRVSIMKGFQLV